MPKDRERFLIIALPAPEPADGPCGGRVLGGRRCARSANYALGPLQLCWQHFEELVSALRVDDALGAGELWRRLHRLEQVAGWICAKQEISVR